ncbi:PLC-like phosphodiesterase [Trichoderma chlorosporum]
MCSLRWLFIFFLLCLSSPVSGFPVPGNKTLSPLHNGTLILKEHEADARNHSSFSLQKRASKWPPGLPLDPEHIDQTWIILINATPYTWKRDQNIHEYQMPDWKRDFPEYINPGVSKSVLIQPRQISGDWRDSGAEVEYHLMGTSEPMSFTVKFHNRGDGTLKVEFHGALSSINNARNSVHDLEIHQFPGGSAFIIAGKEGNFITNDPPINWMQSMLPELKNKPLRELVLGMSHHSGLWSVRKRFGLGTAANTKTQSISLREQLANGGIRSIDFRPSKVGGEFHESHGMWIKGEYHGTMGVTLREMIQAVNEFNREYPGELIIWDVDDTEVWNVDDGFRKLNQQDRMELYKELLTLENRVSVPDDIDVSQLTLGQFIGNKRSAVLINVSDMWRMEDANFFPGARQGFTTGRIFPITHKWTNTDDIRKLYVDQVLSFRKHRPVPQSPIHIAEYILTLQGFNVLKDTIAELALGTLPALFGDFWFSLTSDMYPNWVSVDYVRGNEHKTLIMAMNHCLVAKKCGDLGGKVYI